jgi:UDP-N-acetyl-D-mannosaminuronate dehydrogenase
MKLVRSIISIIGLGYEGLTLASEFKNSFFCRI